MKIISTIACTAIAVLISATADLRAQNPELKSKWGHIPQSDLDMKVYDRDSAATSVILQDIGEISVDFNSRRPLAYFTQVRRIKIFDESAFEKGNLRIPYYSYRNTQRLKDLDVQITSPDGVQQRVKSDNIFTEKINKYWSAEKVFIPNLQKGCIIEYRYNLSSENIFSLFDWYFQHETPVRYSEIQVVLPQKLDYITLKQSRGDIQLKKGQKGDEATYTYYSEFQPAVKPEPYITTEDDYRDKIGFQLSAYYDLRDIRHTVLESWEKLASELKERKDFGDQYGANKQNNDLWDAFAPLYAPGDSAWDIALKAVQFVSTQMEWNGRFSCFASESVNQTFTAKTGNSADLNLALLSLLRRADLEAYPLLLSTVENGKMYEEYPFADQFNSVVVVLMHSGKPVLLDATSPYIKPGQLRSQHYNGKGWLVDKKTQQWIAIPPAERSDVWLGTLSLLESGELKGNFSIMADGYDAREWRSALDKASNPASFIKSYFFGQNDQVSIDSVEISNAKDNSQPLKIKFKFDLPGGADVANDMIYLSPVIHKAFDENPFKTPTRHLPVTMIFPFRQDYIVNITLPDGYQLVDIPKGERTQLPDNGGKITINCSQPLENKVQLVIKNKLSQVNFDVVEYDGLRQFFDILDKNNNIQLVIKKK